MILANFLVGLKSVVLLFAAIFCRKCRLPLTACQKISRTFFVRSSVVSPCFHRSHGRFYMAKWQGYASIVWWSPRERFSARPGERRRVSLESSVHPWEETFCPLRPAYSTR